MTIIVRPFECQRDELTIRGKEFFPDNADRRLAPVIISHGFTADMTSTAKYGEFLAEQGYHAYTFDFCGGGWNTTSDGDFHKDMTPMTEVEDLVAVMKYVVKDKTIDPDQLVLMGLSQGGFVSALTAAEYNERVHALVMYYPALCIPDDARNGDMRGIKFDPANIPDTIGEGKFQLSGEYARSVINMNVYEEIVLFDRPVLIIHGTGDDVVNYNYSKNAKRAYDKVRTPCMIDLLDGAGHGFQGEDDKRAMDLTAEFLHAFIR